MNAYMQQNFAQVEPIVALPADNAISPEEYGKRASHWLYSASSLLAKKRDDAYADGVGEENELTFTQREIDFLIDGIERISRKLSP